MYMYVSLFDLVMRARAFDTSMLQQVREFKIEYNLLGIRLLYANQFLFLFSLFFFFFTRSYQYTDVYTHDSTVHHYESVCWRLYLKKLINNVARFHAKQHHFSFALKKQ